MSDIDALAEGLQLLEDEGLEQYATIDIVPTDEYAKALAATTPVAALLARAALADELQRAYDVAVAAGEVYRDERDAACVLADELAVALGMMPAPTFGLVERRRAALAKWEASKT